MKALRKVQPSWYMPTSEEGAEKPARFKIKPLTPSEYEAVALFIDGRMRIPPERWDRALKVAIVDWENFEGDEGVLGFGFEHFDRIPENERMELVIEIVRRTELTAEEKKT